MQNKAGKESALEPEAVSALRDKGVTVKTGHFGRLSHNKVFIRRRNGVAEAVLAGSANFTIRGLYIQANSVLVFEDAHVAGLYAQAFDQTWDAPAKFKKSPISADWHEVRIEGSRYTFSFAPHETPYPLDEVGKAIDGSKRSVLFAMMQLQKSTGPAVEAIESLPAREDLFSMGVIQHKGDISLFKPDTGDENFTLTSAAYLAKNVPEPFKKEISGGSGQVIHHKLVVCDFNGENPVVFCGSSNLAAGGEKSNSDNLMAIYDRDVAVMYAIETIRQYDHFRFRSLQEGATKTEPLQLKKTDEWARPFYDKGSIRERERESLMYQGK
jgi:phosphatidylserine/phosphatidylglycerophosphate/cardiolipin synthase-like enzyme